MIPVRHVGFDQALVVVEHQIERLGGARGRRRQGRPHVAGPHARKHGVLAHVLEVVGDEIRHPVHGMTEFVGRDIAQRGFGHDAEDTLGDGER